MLTQQRHEMILRLLREKGSITTAEISRAIGISESTARRDIISLDGEGKLVKVFGGAVVKEQQVTAYEYTIEQKSDLNIEEKKKIAKYAASLIENDDFVYIDAGTTTLYMTDYIDNTAAAFVTNGIAHARRLAAKGIKVYLTGGELKATTEALIGNFAMEAVQDYHFTKGFFGTNGITLKSGCTTPDLNEGLVKKTAIGQCRKCYVLSDYTKFGHISSITFASFESVTIICDRPAQGYEKCKNILIPLTVKNFV